MSTARPVLTLTRSLSAAVAAQRFVTVAGAQAGADAHALGVARSAGAAGELVPVDVLGTASVEAGAPVAAGASVKSDAQGRAIPWATAGARLGVALGAAGAGEALEVLLLPQAA